MRDSLLVVGCGNNLGGDDAAGLKVVPLLASAWRGRTSIDFLIMPRAGVELLDIFDREETVLFVDAVTSGRAPGTIVISPLPATGVQQRSSIGSSGFGVVEILALARSLGRRIPRTILLGIEVAARYNGGLVTEPVARAMNYIIESFEEVRVLLNTRELIAFEPEIEPAYKEAVRA
jgi:hydrogenase maturation protease